MFAHRWVASCLLAFACVVCLAQQALTNDSVIKMSKAGLSDDLILQTINTQPVSFSTNASDLVALKQAGLSDRVIGAMLSPHLTTAGAAKADSAGSVDGVDGSACTTRIDPASGCRWRPRSSISSPADF